jgi:hypothetical protein
MDSTEERHFQRWIGQLFSRVGRLDRELLESMVDHLQVAYEVGWERGYEQGQKDQHED